MEPYGTTIENSNLIKKIPQPLPLKNDKNSFGGGGGVCI
jgi:hypothetical protein